MSLAVEENLTDRSTILFYIHFCIQISKHHPKCPTINKSFAPRSSSRSMAKPLLERQVKPNCPDSRQHITNSSSLIIVLITGVSDDSIAGELALQLASANPKLLILSARAESKVAGIKAKISASNPNVQTRFLNMDLSDLSAVRKAVEDLSDVPHIDHLVCVAGVMFPPYSKTKDGFESQFGVNYLANFVLVKLLLPKVRAAGPSSSIVIMASSMVRQGKVQFDDINFSVSSIIRNPTFLLTFWPAEW